MMASVSERVLEVDRRELCVVLPRAPGRCACSRDWITESSLVSGQIRGAALGDIMFVKISDAFGATKYTYNGSGSHYRFPCMHALLGRCFFIVQACQKICTIISKRRDL